MDIDLFTLFAQFVNFLILILILRHFLYGRVIRAMDERQKRILAEQAEAEKKKSEAVQQESEYLRMQRELEDERETILARARQEAGEERTRLSREARNEIEEEKTRWRESLRQQEDVFLRDVRAAIERQVFSTARKALRDLADQDLERKIVETFIDRIRKMDDSRKRDLLEKTGSSGRMKVISAMEIPADVRERLISAIRDVVRPDAEIGFERSSDLLGGIELRVDGSKIAWSLESYLEGLEENMTGVLEGGFGSNRKPDLQERRPSRETALPQ